MRVSLNYTGFLGCPCIRVPYYFGERKRCPNLENFPHEGLRFMI